MLEFQDPRSPRGARRGAALPLSGRNQRALLTLLLLRANEAVSTERLVDQLWGEHPPRTATTSLQNAVSQLRKLLGPALLHTRPTGYLLELDQSQLDLDRSRTRPRGARGGAGAAGALLFAKRLRSGEARRSPTRSWRTSPRTEIHRLEDLRLGVLEERIAADLDPGIDAELIAGAGAARRAASAARAAPRPADARAVPLGRQADALAGVPRRPPHAVDELGIEPGSRAPGALRLDPAAGARRSCRRPPALEDHYDEVMRALVGRPARPGARPGSRRLAGGELARLFAERFELPARIAASRTSHRRGGAERVGPLYDELHLALDRDAEPAPCTPGSPSLPPLLRATRAAAPADRLDVLRHRRRAGIRGGGRGARRRRLRRRRPRPRQVPAHRARWASDRGSTSRTPTPASRWRTDRAAQDPRRTSTAASTRERESFAVSEDDHIDYLVGGDATGAVPGRSSQRGCVAAISSSSATPSTTGACASSSDVSGAATDSRTARGRSSLRRSTLPASSGASAASRSTTSRSRHTPKSSRGSPPRSRRRST